MHTKTAKTSGHTTFKSSAEGRAQTLARREARFLKRGW